MTLRAVSRDALRAEAANWFVLRQSGDMSAEDERRFRIWIDESEDNRRAFDLIDRVWTIAGTAGEAPEVVAAREEDLVRFDRSSSWRRTFAIAASLLLVVTTSWAMFGTPLSEHGAKPPVKQVFHTSLGQRTNVTLPDGSMVTLDSETEMVLRETPEQRLVELVGGRAYFRVAKDPNRPFIVMAEGKSVRAIGTAFAVSVERNDVVVTLAEGRVRVEDVAGGSGTSVDMSPGRQLVAPTNRDWALRRVDATKETSWTSGRLTYMRDPLFEVVAEMNRYSKRKLKFEGNRIPDKRIVGVFEAGDVDSFVKAMELNGIARVTADGPDEILLSAE